MLRDAVVFYLNGEKVTLKGGQAFAPLSDTIRYALGKTGTKVVCAEGDCGACTVLIARATGTDQNQRPAFKSINSCISSTFLLDGCHVVTIEGLAETSGPCEIQHSMIRNHGGQCGFCTPGIVMALANMCEENAPATERAAKNYLTGNLCRCTGYTPILKAAIDIDRAKQKSCGERYLQPPANADLTNLTEQALHIADGNREIFAPTTLQTAAEFLEKYPEARVFSGATDVGVQINKGRDPGAKRLSLHLIQELYQFKSDKDTVTVGARVTLADFESHVSPLIPALGDFLHLFASPQIKNAGTLVGNLANGSPIGDTLPFLLTVGAIVHLHGVNGARDIAITDFFKGYRKLDILPGELIRAVSFPIPGPQARLGLYKISQRRDLDISAVNASFDVTIDGGTIKRAAIAYGGVAATPIRLPEIEKFLVGKTIDRQLIDATKKKIATSIKPLSDVRGSTEFRLLIAENLFEKFARERLLS